GEGRKLLALAQDRGSRRRVEIALRDAAALRLPSVLRGVRALSRSSAPSNRSPAPCCARRPTPGDEVPRETDRDPAEAGKPDPGLHPEREPETGHEPDGGNGTRIEARFAREPQRGEVREGVIDEHGERAEGPGRLHVPREREDGDDRADDEHGPSRRAALLVELG